MGQTTAPPISVRLGDVRSTEIDTYATERGLKRHAAILELIDVGLHGSVQVASGRPTPKPIPGSLMADRKAEAARAAQAAHMEREGAAFAADMERRALDLPIGPVARKPGDMLKKGKKP